MRITENSNYNLVRDGIQRSKERMENLQLQSATLKKLKYPSDDPVAASKLLELRTDKMTNEQLEDFAGNWTNMLFRIKSTYNYYSNA